MAKIESITFSITRTSHPTGHICSMDYSYILHLSEDEMAHHDSFNVLVVPHGIDLVHSKPIGEPPYDCHIVESLDNMPVQRKFAIDCHYLDEAWGEDKIYLLIEAQSNRGLKVSAKSAVVKDWF